MKMQKLVLSVLLLSATVSVVQAQTEVGRVLLSGNVGYSYSESENTPINSSVDRYSSGKSTFNSFTFTPQVGFFVADHIALGLSLGVAARKGTDVYTYPSTNSLDPYTAKSSSRDLNIGPFVRYYQMVGEKAAFYGQLAGGYQHGSTTSRGSTSSSEATSNGGYANITPGFVFFPTNRFGLELTLGNLGYSSTKQKVRSISGPEPLDSNNKASSFATNFGIQYLSLGASFYLGKS